MRSEFHGRLPPYLGCTAEGGRGSVELDVLLAQAEVGEDDVALLVEQDVLGLQVPVHDVEGVEVAQGAGDLGGVEARPRLQEASLPLQVVEELEETKRREIGTVSGTPLASSTLVF